MHDSIDFIKVSIADARNTVNPFKLNAEIPKASPVVQLRRNSLSPQMKLTKEAATWLMSLPPASRPLILARKFPRIANELALIWGDTATCEMKLNSYLIDERGNRLGFPIDVAKDLMDLKAYFDKNTSGQASRQIVKTPDGNMQTVHQAPSLYHRGKRHS